MAAQFGAIDCVYEVEGAQCGRPSTGAFFHTDYPGPVWTCIQHVKPWLNDHDLTLDQVLGVTRKPAKDINENTATERQVSEDQRQRR